MAAMDASWTWTAAIVTGWIVFCLGAGVLIVSVIEWFGNRRWMQ